MKEKLKKYLLEALKFILILTIFLNAISYYKSLDLNKENLNFKEFTLLNNTQYKINENKPLIIHFWATWCPTCKIEANNIEKISKKYQVITIASQSGNNKNINAYLKENRLNFKVVNDNNGFYSKAFNIKAFPTTIIYDKNKKVRFSEVGYTSTFGLYLRMWFINLF